MTRYYISTLKKNMVSIGFRLKKTDKTRNYALEEIEHNYLMSEKHKAGVAFQYLHLLHYLIFLLVLRVLN